MSTLEHITVQIVGECAASGLEVSESVVFFLVKSMVVESTDGVDMNQRLTEEEVTRVSQLVLKELRDKSNICLDTNKMQSYFTKEYTSRDDLLEKIHEAQELRLRRVNREIVESRARSSEDLNHLYTQIVSYMLLSSGMASPADDIINKEVKAALHSVFPPTSLETFVKLLQRDKERKLKELATVVVGVWLYNRTSKTSKQETFLKELLSTSHHNPPVLKELEKALMTSQGMAWKYTAALEMTVTGADGGAVPLSVLKAALYSVRQQEQFLKLLLSDARRGVHHEEELRRGLWSQLELLQKTVQTMKSVPTTKVFPLFQILSKLWSGLQEEAELLGTCSRVMSGLQTCLAETQTWREAELDQLLEGSEVKTDAQRMMDGSAECINPEEMEEQDWIFPGTSEDVPHLPLQYDGFCGYTLVTFDGLLLPGNPSIGVLRHMKKFYVFSSGEAARMFARRPNYFISEVEEKAKQSPDLIHLLQLHLLPSLSEESRCEMSTQTDVHPLETHLERSYHWNEWELRRRAIQLTNLRTKATHSAQTSASHMRRENCSQTWRRKETGSQTRRDGHSNVPRPQVYLAGVRGRRLAGMQKIDLTRHVED